MEEQELQKKIPLVVIVGPTASGKSKLAVELAHWLQTEIVSADSMQIYRGMQIGTAKPTVEEMEGIAHHLIDFVELNEPFSVADYVAHAKTCVERIAQKGKPGVEQRPVQSTPKSAPVQVQPTAPVQQPQE